jgi:hypothetical protein
MEHLGTLAAVLLAVGAMGLAYSSIPRIRSLQKRLDELESKIDSK